MLKSIIKVTVPLLLICLIVSALLALTYDVTKDSIDEQNRLAVQASQKKVLSAASVFEEKKLQVNGTETGYFEGKSTSGDVLGYVFVTNAKGYGGSVSVMCGISADGKITGVLITNSNETPGMGKKAEDSSFTGQYLQNIPANGFKTVKGGASKGNEIDVITGATITSNAVTTAVNEAITSYRQIVNGGKA